MLIYENVTAYDTEQKTLYMTDNENAQSYTAFFCRKEQSSLSPLRQNELRAARPALIPQRKFLCISFAQKHSAQDAHPHVRKVVSFPYTVCYNGRNRNKCRGSRGCGGEGICIMAI